MGKAKQRYLQALKKFQRTPETQRGTLGNMAGQVKVPNQPDMVYVIVAGLGVREVKNTKVANIPGTPVKIGYDPLEPNIFQVLDTVSYPQTYNAPQYTNSVGTHGATHNWSGNDVVWIEKRQLMPLRITAIGAMNLALGRDVIWNDTQWIYHGGVTFNMSAAIPSTGSRYALIYAGATGSYGILTGTVRDLQTMLFSDLPDPIPGTIPTAIIRLYAGQTGISEGYNDTDIIDVRGLFTPVGSGAGGVTGAINGSDIALNTSNFNHNLSAADNTVQKALETLDEITAGVGMTNPMTAANDIIYGGVSGAATRLGIGSNNQVLTLVSGTMSWANPVGGTPTFHGCKVYRSTSAQTFANLSNSAVIWDAEDYDTDAYHGVSGAVCTIPAGLAGYYHILLHIEFSDSDYFDSGEIILCQVYQSSTVLSRNNALTKMFGGAVETTVIAYLSEGTTIAGHGYQATGGDLDLDYTQKHSYMILHYLGT